MDLLETQRPNVIEDSEDERDEAVWKQAFDRAKRAIETQLELSSGAPFSLDEAGKLASVFLNDIDRLKENISNFEGPIDPNFPASTRT